MTELGLKIQERILFLIFRVSTLSVIHLSIIQESHPKVAKMDLNVVVLSG
jgi:hypothetical protein